VSDFEIGQVVIVTERFGQRGHSEMTVTKLGRKYVYVGEGYKQRKFDAATGAENLPGGYSGGSLFTVKKWEERRQLQQLWGELKPLGLERVWGAASAALTVSQLERVVAILSEVEE
jgi:hypothetical protein